MTDEWVPATQPAGDLVPPGRHPPTAVGALTPPPPHQPGRPPGRAPSPRRRLAGAFLGLSGSVAGIVAATVASHPAALVASAVLVLAGAGLLGMSLRKRRPRP